MNTILEALKELNEGFSDSLVKNHYKDQLETIIQKIKEEMSNWISVGGGQLSDKIITKDGYTYFTAVYSGNAVEVDEEDFEYDEGWEEDPGGWDYLPDMDEQAYIANEDVANLSDSFSDEFGWTLVEGTKSWYNVTDTDIEVCCEPDFEAEGDEPEVTNAWYDPGDYWNPPEGEFEFEPESYSTKIIITFRVKTE